MSHENQHIIGKQVMEIKLPAGADGNGWLERISIFCNNILNHKLEELFDRYAGADELIQIDKLEVDIGNLYGTVSDDELAVIIGNRLEEQLYSLIVLKNRFLNGEEIHIKRLPAEEEIFDEWLYYLEYGLMPWQAEKKKEDELTEIVLGSLSTGTNAVEKFRTLLTGNERSVDRLIIQHKDDFLILLLEAYTANKQQFMKQLLTDLELLEKRWIQHAGSYREVKRFRNTQDPLRMRFWRYLIRSFITGRGKGVQTLKVIENEQAGDLIKDLFINSEYHGIAKFLKREIKNSRSYYPGLCGLPQKVVEKIIGNPKVQETAGIIAFKKENYSDDENKPSADGREPVYPDQTEVKAGQDENIPETKSGEKKYVEAKQADTNETDTESSEIKHTEREIAEVSQPESGNREEKNRETKNKESKSAERRPPETKHVEEIRKRLHVEEVAEVGGKGPDEKDITATSMDKTDEYSFPETYDFSETDSFLKNKQGALKQAEIMHDKGSLAESVKEGVVIYVYNAGVVLLNPFFAGYFRKVGLVVSDDFFDNEARQRGVHLIQYMATGETGMPDYEMILAKLLCGIQIEDPVERFIELSATELDEVEVMMQSAIEHWGAVGKASPDGLREGFLQRDGRLEKRQNGWHLKVERKTIDILLDRLPFGWGIGTIKLPWMKEILHLEW